MGERRAVAAGFTASRQTVLDTLYKMGARCCSYSYDLKWANRCDCKYGLADGWPTANESGNGCPELRSLYVVIEAMADEEWALLTRRAGGIPSGLFAASPQEMEKRLHAADAAACMAAEQIAQVRRMLTLELPEPTSQGEPRRLAPSSESPSESRPDA